MNWCAEHKSNQVEDLGHCWKRQWLLDAAGTTESCRMVEALLIVKEDGEWPEWAALIVRDWANDDLPW